MSVWRDELECEGKNDRKAFIKPKSLPHPPVSDRHLAHNCVTQLATAAKWTTPVYLPVCVCGHMCMCVWGGTCACGRSQLSPVHWVHMEKNSRSDERSTWGPCLRYWVWPGMCVCVTNLCIIHNCHRDAVYRFVIVCCTFQTDQVLKWSHFCSAC